MKTKEVKSVFILLLTAAIWGFAFVAQRVGMQHVGAFTFNGVRFALGSISLLPVIYFFNRKNKEQQKEEADLKSTVKSGLIAGSVLFIAASLQQIGLIYTTAGKAGFITSLYIVLVPIIGILFKQKTHTKTWIGALTAAIGLYFLSINESFTIEFGDFLEIIGAVFWACHILLIDRFVKNVDAIKLSSIQFATCAVLSMITAFITEDVNAAGISGALVPILYGGIMSAGVAYTLQAVGQKYAKPSHAAIALSMESVFAAIGGIVLLAERMSPRGYLGCALMLLGMLIAQSENFGKENPGDAS
ncbi:EamA-like transporter family protein [anaerobic digester metagenome]|uniref:Drug/metabolite transporter (DMT)-like permease n=1 Tax=Sedimentibacter saalensis TaxID=130788 RepID=A0A562J8D3_9FIRM|nr:DMT family transporter [Sedimentibacter saalensis]TWH79456.1 drug/metabolite transporter (DMT)-like permease [Sedimentibacter saalensis]